MSEFNFMDVTVMRWLLTEEGDELAGYKKAVRSADVTCYSKAVRRQRQVL
jgi:hypothetical protein